MAAEQGVVTKIPVDRDTRQRKGFFFIKPDGGSEDVFAHASGLKVETKSFQDVQVGDRVEYKVISSDKGPRALDIRIV